jgi:hypothetical protein
MTDSHHVIDLISDFGEGFQTMSEVDGRYRQCGACHRSRDNTRVHHSGWMRVLIRRGYCYLGQKALVDFQEAP